MVVNERSGWVKYNSKEGEEESEEMALSSLTWGYARIIAGTLVGGTIGFYVMHRIEVRYKMKMEEALRQYEKEMKKRQEDHENLGLISEDSL
ncbi:unnamed protein product [Brassica oleracea]|nr:unnamed protein product [Brassica napus]